jgi:hypothetical protein
MHEHDEAAAHYEAMESQAAAEHEASLAAEDGFAIAQQYEDERDAALRRLVELDLKKPEIQAYYEEREKVLARVAEYIGVNGYFKASDGTVFKIVEPAGKFVTFSKLDYERTKRDGEVRGTLSMKEAKDAEANGFQPLP